MLVVTRRTPDKAKIFMIKRRSKDPLTWQWVVNTLYEVDNTVWQQNGVLSKAKLYHWFVYIVGRHNVLMNASRITAELLHLFVNLQALLGMTMFAIFSFICWFVKINGWWYCFWTVPRDVMTVHDKTWEEPRLCEIQRDVVHVIDEL